MLSRTVDEDPRVALLKELVDPLRLRVIDRLGHAGPATVSRLAAELGVSLPQLSNHLRRLRDAGLVSVRRSGRQAIYELADPGLQQLLPLLDSITGRVLAEAPSPTSPPTVPSRTCYEHLGGEIGVAVYRGLRERDALRPRADGMVSLGPAAAETFGALGLDVEALDPGRQRLAFECLDSTERAPHLAGALGDAVAGTLVGRRWIRRTPGSRVISLTPSGARGLRSALGIELTAR
ncbi:MAG: helix-turn-helix transcriptional regulator [Solirubrobacterales bacterium]|nr:helix-turn-helix transcriptional regulator [Solirubrobacterales bacterium]